MNILLLGSGGREHALAWKMAKSPACTKLYIAPGNAGTPAYGENVNLSVSDFEGIKAFCIDKRSICSCRAPKSPWYWGFTISSPPIRHYAISR